MIDDQIMKLLFYYFQVISPTLSEPCKTLEDELDHVKFEIVKMISDKEHASKENETLKKYQNQISELQKQNEQLKQTFNELECSTKTDPHHQQRMNEKVSIPDILVDNNSFVELITSTDRSSPDGREIDDDCLTQPCQRLRWNKSEIAGLEEKIEKLEETKFVIEFEKNKLLENNK